MSTMTAPEKMWTDEHQDPGPTDATPPHHKAATRSVLAAVRAGVLPDLPPAVLALPDALARFQDFERDVLTGPQPENSRQLVDRVAVALVSGKSVPDPASFTDDVRAATQVAASADALPYTLASVRRQTEQTVRATLADHAPALLDGIRSQVAATITQARQATEVLAGLDHTDPAAVAEATDPQRAALRTLAGLAVSYNRLRKLQRAVLVATGEPVGMTSLSPSTFGWSETFTLGIHECARANLADHGPAATLPPVTRLLALAARPDVWTPTREELEHRWAELHNPHAVRQEAEREQPEPGVKVTGKRRAGTVAAATPA